MRYELVQGFSVVPTERNSLVVYPGIDARTKSGLYYTLKSGSTIVSTRAAIQRTIFVRLDFASLAQCATMLEVGSPNFQALLWGIAGRKKQFNFARGQMNLWCLRHLLPQSKRHAIQLDISCWVQEFYQAAETLQQAMAA